MQKYPPKYTNKALVINGCAGMCRNRTNVYMR